MNLFSIFRNLVSIPSVSGRETEIKKHICSFFFSIGYRKDEDEKGNMLFYHRIGKKTPSSAGWR
ncbi:MAG TPA: hypothetical protein IAB12_04700 [Candidatus Ornithospirochaeta avicola]|uniref:Uncharacterized protein n=1 Tax=Candidatus Ornithospirochaeta avicola TaxID=2840896 RepID=A0A9D1PUW3_9SPIO|nr:hypothetical protein [Candidatus Ornithospirochaeta avicola]